MKSSMKKRTYEDLIKYKTFDDRFKYLLNTGSIGDYTLGGYRDLYQRFLRSREWRTFSRQIVIRDLGCDLACPGYEIATFANVHHIEGVTIEDILDHRMDILLNPSNVITVSPDTHKAIEFGNLNYLNRFKLIERTPNDTATWRK